MTRSLEVKLEHYVVTGEETIFFVQVIKEKNIATILITILDRKHI